MILSEATSSDAKLQRPQFSVEFTLSLDEPPWLLFALYFFISTELLREFYFHKPLKSDVKMFYDTMEEETMNLQRVQAFGRF